MPEAANPARKPATKTEVFVTYNGRVEAFRFIANQRVRALLNQALGVFQIRQDRRLMRLFDASGNELNLELSLGQAGVKPGDQLVLRQTVVRGG